MTRAIPNRPLSRSTLSVRMTRDAGNRYPATFKLDEEQNVVSHEASPRQHLNGEEVASGQHIHMGR